MKALLNNARRLRIILLVTILPFLIGLSKIVAGATGLFSGFMMILSIVILLFYLYLLYGMVFGKDERWRKAEYDFVLERARALDAQGNFHFAAGELMNQVLLYADMNGEEDIVVDEDFDPTSVGLVNKYRIFKTNGKPIPPDARYFVLRLDPNQKDKHFLLACRKAIRTFATAIRPHLPKLATDLTDQYGKEGDPISITK